MGNMYRVYILSIGSADPTLTITETQAKWLPDYADCRTMLDIVRKKLAECEGPRCRVTRRTMVNCYLCSNVKRKERKKKRKKTESGSHSNLARRYAIDARRYKE